MRLKCILSVALVFLLVISLCGCGSMATVDLTGEWKGTVDISDQLTQIPGLDEPPSGITFDLIFVFGEDGSFEAIVDQYSVKLMVDKLLDVVAAELAETAQEKGLSDAQLRKLLESSVDTEEIVRSTQASLQNGYYLYSDGVIYLSALPEPTAETAQEHLLVTVSGDALTVQEIVSDTYQHDQMISGVLPLTLHKQ